MTQVSCWRCFAAKSKEGTGSGRNGLWKSWNMISASFRETWKSVGRVWGRKDLRRKLRSSLPMRISRAGATTTSHQERLASLRENFLNSADSLEDHFNSQELRPAPRPTS